MKDKLVKTHVFKHPIAEVWSAITDAKKISTWFLKAEFKAEVGSKYKFTHEKTTISGEILKANPYTELVYTWIVSGTEAVTTVSWKLEDNDGETHLTLEHTGISNYPGETAIAMFDSFTEGWQNCITNLDKYLKN